MLHAFGEGRAIWEHAPLWLIGIGVFALLVACVEFGFWGRKQLERVGHSTAVSREGESFLLSAALGLLALLLGFTFSLALERFETRRGLVLQEANSLSIVWLQTRLMPSPHRERMGGLLQEYVDHRLAWSEADAPAPSLAQTARMRENLWIAATDATRSREPEFLGPDLRGSLETSFNLAAARSEARTSHIPGRVISVLLLYAALSSIMLGYVLQYTGKHHRIAANMLVLLLTIALVLILDVDRPRSGAITISQQPLEQLVEVMRASAPVRAPP